KSIDVMDPTSELGRFEEKVRREEALVAGKQEIAASTLDSQFETLEELDKATEVDARLVELKSGKSPQAITSGE
ncbi:MAG: PspA/IM30 family protein, partial [Rhodoglobus sp.]